MVQFLKRAKGHSGEVVSFTAKENEVKDEANRRSAKAGYTNRQGEPLHRTKLMTQGFGKSKMNVWPRDANGNLID